MMQAPVQHRRRRDADVHDVEAAVGESLDQRVPQRPAAMPVVPANRHRALDAALGEHRGIPAANALGGLDGEVVADDTTNVILTEDACADHGSFRTG